MKPTFETHGAAAVLATYEFLRPELARHDREKDLNLMRAEAIATNYGLNFYDIEPAEFVRVETLKALKLEKTDRVDLEAVTEFKVALLKSEAALHQKDIDAIGDKLEICGDILGLVKS